MLYRFSLLFPDNTKKEKLFISNVFEKKVSFKLLLCYMLHVIIFYPSHIIPYILVYSKLFLCGGFLQWSPAVSLGFQQMDSDLVMMSLWARMWHSCANRGTWWLEEKTVSVGPAPTMGPGVEPCQYVKVNIHKSIYCALCHTHAGVQRELEGIFHSAKLLGGIPCELL